MTVVEEVFSLFEKRGSESYFGEPVSVTEHCLQAAYAAQTEGAPAALVVAALLHDVGHLIDDIAADIAEWTADAKHEEVGGCWLAMRFGPDVHEPVRLHVPAKRYLCAVEPSYFARLSPASIRTLELQGGPMSAAEVAAFEGERYFAQAVRIRRWDDSGKIAGLVTPRLTDYRGLVAALAAR